MDNSRHEKRTSSTMIQFIRLNKRPILIAAIAVAFILIGLLRVNGDEVKTLLRKAINICMECIGIG